MNFDDLGYDDFDEYDFDEEADHRLELLEDMLEELTVGELRQIAKRRVWTLKGTRKDNIVEQMAEQMLEALEDPRMLSGLTTDERALLSGVNTIFGIMLPLEQSQFDYIWRDVLKRRGDAQSAIEGLVSYGLFIKTEDSWGPQSFNYYRPLLPLPPSILPVMALVTPLYKSPRQQPVVPIFPAPSLVNQLERVGYYAAAGGYTGPMPQEGLFHPAGHESPWIGNWPYLAEEENKIARTAYFRYMSEPPILTVPVRLHVVDQQTFHALRDVVSSWETLDWIMTFLNNTGIVGQNEEGKYIFDAEMWQRFLDLDDAEKPAFLFNLWASGSVDIYELRLMLREHPDWRVWRMAHPDIRYDAFLAEFIFARHYLLRMLRGLAENNKKDSAWYSLPRFIEGLVEYRPDIYHMLSSDETWGFKKDDYLITLEEEEVWDQTVVDMMQSLFTGPLYWLNIVDLHIQQGKVEAFRLTDMGLHLLAPTQHDAPADVRSEGEAEWIDGQTIRVTPGRELNALMGLISRITIPVSGKSFTYRIGGPGLEGIFADGDTPETLAARFAELGYPLPAEAQRYLAGIYERFGRVHLYDELTLVEFSDDTALVELRAAGLLRDVLQYEFSPRLIAIHPDKVDEFAARLEAKGYTPKVTDGAGS